MKKKKVSVLLEFGIPPYRDFLFKYINSISDSFIVIHNGEKFINENNSFNSLKCDSFDLYKFKFYLKINKYLRNSDVIVSSFNFWRPSCWLPLFLFKKKEVILWGHIQGSYDSLFSRYFKKICIKRAKYVLAYTEKGRKYAIDSLGANIEKVLVVRNTLSVSNSIFNMSARKYFLYVGRVQKRKNLSVFIKALKDISYSGELFRIVGDGENKADLIRLVEKLNLTDKVKFYPGTFDDDSLIKHFDNALAYVSPSQIGLGVVHSFAYGIPVLSDITLNHGPEFEYCDDQNSFLYNGEQQLIPTVKAILSNNKISFDKGKKAYDFYNSSLKPENMEKVFLKAIYK